MAAPTRAAGAPSAEPPLVVSDDRLRKIEANLVDVGDRAVWRVSSAKHGNGVVQLRDGNPNTFWQSDGVQPHMVEVTFQRLTAMVCIAIRLNFAGDESYTPRRLNVRVGTHPGDMAEVAAAELESPNGWLLLYLAPEAEASVDGTPGAVFGTVLQLNVVENHQNGRDTHVRGIKVYSFLPQPVYSTALFESFTMLR